MRRARPVRPFLRLPAKAAAMVLGSARVFVGILEDLPYDSNRVLPGDDAAATPRIDYAIAPELAARRRDGLRGLLAAAARHPADALAGRRIVDIDPAIRRHPLACDQARFAHQLRHADVS